MKVKYEVFREKDYDATTGHSSYERVSSFRGEKEALDFISDFKNISRYGELFLEMRDSDGERFKWDNDTKTWTPI